jgi:hypothetical protein
VDNRSIAIALGMMGEPEDPGHRTEHISLHAKETQEMPLRSSESIGPALSATNTVMRMKIRRWELAAYTVHRTQVPKGFKLPHDHQKYDGSQEPEFWLSDYLQVVKILGGLQGNNNVKLATTPKRICQVVAKEAAQRLHRQLGRTCKEIHQQLPVYIQRQWKR